MLIIDLLISENYRKFFVAVLLTRKCCFGWERSCSFQQRNNEQRTENNCQLHFNDENEIVLNKCEFQFE